MDHRDTPLTSKLFVDVDLAAAVAAASEAFKLCSFSTSALIASAAAPSYRAVSCRVVSCRVASRRVVSAHTKCSSIQQERYHKQHNYTYRRCYCCEYLFYSSTNSMHQQRSVTKVAPNVGGGDMLYICCVGQRKQTCQENRENLSWQSCCTCKSA